MSKAPAPLHHYLALTLALFVLGMLSVWQLKVKQRVTDALQPESSEVVAVEVARLTNANADLRKQLADLSQQEYTLASSLTDKKTAEDSLAAKKSQADLLNGTTTATGPGVRLTVKEYLTVSQQIDLLNALNNIGAQAVALDGQRVDWHYSPWRVEVSVPLVFEALGSPAALDSALKRRGGILDLLKDTGTLDYTLEQIQSLTLPAGSAPTANNLRTASN